MLLYLFIEFLCFSLLPLPPSIRSHTRVLNFVPSFVRHGLFKHLGCLLNELCFLVAFIHVFYCLSFLSWKWLLRVQTSSLLITIRTHWSPISSIFMNLGLLSLLPNLLKFGLFHQVVNWSLLFLRSIHFLMCTLLILFLLLGLGIPTILIWLLR